VIVTSTLEVLLTISKGILCFKSRVPIKDRRERGREERREKGSKGEGEKRGRREGERRGEKRGR
jgi:hypothetical protein